ncbi:hypothetical protein GCM10009724_12820 [Microbacterium lacticum]|nr:hypothetical protein MLA01_10970 [Microbacterium lacticum]GGN20132.1 hypothetical protein GCM10009724_12820 [Microbacterium lacticum]
MVIRAALTAFTGISRSPPTPALIPVTAVLNPSVATPRNAFHADTPPVVEMNKREVDTRTFAGSPPLPMVETLRRTRSTGTAGPGCRTVLVDGSVEPPWFVDQTS